MCCSFQGAGGSRESCSDEHNRPNSGRAQLLHLISAIQRRHAGLMLLSCRASWASLCKRATLSTTRCSRAYQGCAGQCSAISTPDASSASIFRTTTGRKSNGGFHKLERPSPQKLCNCSQVCFIRAGRSSFRGLIMKACLSKLYCSQMSRTSWPEACVSPGSQALDRESAYLFNVDGNLRDSMRTPNMLNIF